MTQYKIQTDLDKKIAEFVANGHCWSITFTASRIYLEKRTGLLLTLEFTNSGRILGWNAPMGF